MKVVTDLWLCMSVCECRQLWRNGPVARTWNTFGFGQIVPGGISSVGVTALEANSADTSGEMLVPSKYGLTGNGRILGSAKKNFSALVIPVTSQPLTKKGLVDMPSTLSISQT
jgi:hypothetical protein